MSHFEDHNWEDHWREEVNNYTPQANTTDWASMDELLDAVGAPQGDRIIDQEPPTKPTQPSWQQLASMPWYQWLIVIIGILGLGYGLGVRQSALLTDELKELTQRIDSLPKLDFPPNYRVNEYYTYDAAGNRSGSPVSDTTFFAQRIVRRAPRQQPATAAEAQRIFVDTLYILDQQGNLSGRYDSVYGNGVRLSSVPVGNSEEHENSHLPTLPGSHSDGTSLPALVPPTAPASAPTIPPRLLEQSGRSTALPGNRPVTLGVVVPPIPSLPINLGADYWERQLEKHLESGRLQVKRIDRENGYYPPIRQRF